MLLENRYQSSRRKIHSQIKLLKSIQRDFQYQILKDLGHFSSLRSSKEISEL